MRGGESGLSPSWEFLGTVRQDAINRTDYLERFWWAGGLGAVPQFIIRGPGSGYSSKILA